VADAGKELRALVEETAQAIAHVHERSRRRAHFAGAAWTERIDLQRAAERLHLFRERLDRTHLIADEDKRHSQQQQRCSGDPTDEPWSGLRFDAVAIRFHAQNTPGDWHADFDELARTCRVIERLALKSVLETREHVSVED